MPWSKTVRTVEIFCFGGKTMKKIFILMAVLGLLAAGPLAGISFAYGTFPSSTFSTYTANNAGTQYFSHTSSDNTGNGYTSNNVGFYIQGGSGQPNAPNLLGNAEYLVVPVTTGIYFSNGLSDAFNLLRLAGDKAATSFGYYEVNSLGVRIGPDTEVFAAGSLTVPNAAGTKEFTLPDYFGLYLKDTASGAGTFHSTFAADPGGSGNVENEAGSLHFAVFRDSAHPECLYVGMEDRYIITPGKIGDRDYNDMVVELCPAAVPLPGALLLLGGGLVRLVAYGRKRRLLAT
jgi:hypothetical protein